MRGYSASHAHTTEFSDWLEVVGKEPVFQADLLLNDDMDRDDVRF